MFDDTEVVIESPFVLHLAGVRYELDPTERSGLGPLLSLYPDMLEAVGADPSGTLLLRFDQAVGQREPGPRAPGDSLSHPDMAEPTSLLANEPTHGDSGSSGSCHCHLSLWLGEAAQLIRYFCADHCLLVEFYRAL